MIHLTHYPFNVEEDLRLRQLFFQIITQKK
jgi:hypothetical protein